MVLKTQPSFSFLHFVENLEIIFKKTLKNSKNVLRRPPPHIPRKKSSSYTKPHHNRCLGQPLAISWFFRVFVSCFLQPAKKKQKQRDRHVGHAFCCIWDARFGHQAALAIITLACRKPDPHAENHGFLHHAENHMQKTTLRHLGDYI